MNNDIKNLILEFQSEGASRQEAEELAYFGKNLSNSVNLQRSHQVKLRFLANLPETSNNNFFFRKHLIASVFAVILILSGATLVSAQKSLPGQPLYPVKRVVENVLGTINPSYKTNTLKVRSEEIKSISGKSESQVFQKAVDDYEHELNAAPAIDTKKLEESRQNLEEAVVKESSEENRQILENAINRTEDRRKEIEDQGVKGIHTDYNRSYDRESEKDSNFR